MVDPVLKDLPLKLRDGDLAWLRTQYDSGALDALRDQVTPDQWATVGSALEVGDLDVVRDTLKDVQIEGVGPVVLPKRNNLPWIIAAAVAAVVVIALVIWLLVRDND